MEIASGAKILIPCLEVLYSRAECIWKWEAGGWEQCGTCNGNTHPGYNQRGLEEETPEIQLTKSPNFHAGYVFSLAQA